jgi:hypothetical protein
MYYFDYALENAGRTAACGAGDRRTADSALRRPGGDR